MFKKRDSVISECLVAAASDHGAESSRQLNEFATALTLPLRQAIFDCDNRFDIFEAVDFRDQSCVEFPIDPIQPGMENDFKAFAVPDCSCLPCVLLEADYVTIPTYEIANCVEWCMKRARKGNLNIVDRATEAFRAGFTKKMNDDGWHVLVASGLDRNIIVRDSAAVAGQFTKRLVSLMKLVMRRNGGGNSTCLNRGQLTDLFLSPEGMEDIRNWNVDQVDEITRREIFVGADCDNGLTRIFCVNLHALDELGVNQEYQLYYENDLSGVLPAGKQEIVVGLDLANRDSFVQPIVSELEVFGDDSMRKCRRQGIYGFFEGGFSALSSRRVLLGAI